MIWQVKRTSLNIIGEFAYCYADDTIPFVSTSPHLLAWQLCMFVTFAKVSFRERKITAPQNMLKKKKRNRQIQTQRYITAD